MKFKKDGKVYGITSAVYRHCENTDCMHCGLRNKGENCVTYAHIDPKEAARLMGYEAIEDTPDSENSSKDLKHWSKEKIEKAVVEKHGEDVKPKRRTLGTSNPMDDIAEYAEKYLEAVKPRKLTRADILHKAEECVCGHREQDYGSLEDNFSMIGELWAVYLKSHCVSLGADVDLSAADVAMMMALFKIARIATGTGTADSFIDLAGYAACGAECKGVEE